MFGKKSGKILSAVTTLFMLSSMAAPLTVIHAAETYTTAVYKNLEDGSKTDFTSDSNGISIDSEAYADKFGLGTVIKNSKEGKYISINTNLNSLSDLAEGTYVETEFDLAVHLETYGNKSVSILLGNTAGDVTVSNNVLYATLYAQDGYTYFQPKLMKESWGGTPGNIPMGTMPDAISTTDMEHFKFVMHVETDSNDSVKKWKLDKAVYNGKEYAVNLYSSQQVDYSCLSIKLPWSGTGSYVAVDNLQIASYVSSDGTSPVPDRYAFRTEAESFKTEYAGLIASIPTVAAALTEAEEKFNTESVTQEELNTALAGLKAFSAYLPSKKLFYDFVNSGADKTSIITDRVSTLNSTKFADYAAYGTTWSTSALKPNVFFDAINFDDLGNNSYIETEFDICYTLNDCAYTELYLRSGASLALIPFRFTDSRAYVNTTGTAADGTTALVKGKLQAESSENTMHRVKAVFKVKNEDGSACHKITGFEYDGKDILNGAVLDVANADQTSYSNFSIQHKVKDGITSPAYPDIYIDNFSVATYSSDDGKSPITDKYELLEAVNTVSEIKKNNPLLTVNNDILDNCVSVLQDVTATESETVNAVNSANGIVEDWISDEITWKAVSGLDEAAVTGDLRLADQFSSALIGKDFDIRWSSDNPDIINPLTGKVLLPKTDLNVCLTASLSCGDADITYEPSKNFNVTVKGSADADNYVICGLSLEDADGVATSYPKLGGSIAGVSIFDRCTEDGEAVVAVAAYVNGVLKNVNIKPLVSNVDSRNKIGTTEINLALSSDESELKDTTIQVFVFNNMNSIVPMCGKLKYDVKDNTLSGTRIFIVGDSTACDYTKAEYYPREGWGQELQQYFNSDITVVNKAKSGTGTESFYNNYWSSVISEVDAGDYVIVQFAHNDPALEEPYTATETYKENVMKFVNDIKAKNATPILMSSVTRRWFGSSGVLSHSKTDLQPYGNAMRELADENGLIFIDMYNTTYDLVNTLGDTKSKKLYVHFANAEEQSYYDSDKLAASTLENREDNTHLSFYGASAYAKLAAAAVKGTDTGLAGYVNENVGTVQEVISELEAEYGGAQ